ncbi:hypothetical protein [Amycolatopsis cihanbeyliensis]|uniref:Uncharacterized protein n=1 Tax=Amycolatopsis cihanbeyliensis TaxID=1128664 RepID=A0A542DG52_AMYCI|nr:hypothetical protein [Amycolatopsis cihanbeyliensis]TQJ02024.1 hypothetical protein FB471_1741 [Amycolatopsis cihanbeyliensis]
MLTLTLVDTASWLSWITAYLLGMYAIHRYGKSRMRYVLVFIGLALGVIGYLVVAWRFGRWPALYAGMTLTAGLAVFLALARRRADRCG